MRTRVISVHYLRVIARMREREVQHVLERHAVGVTVAGVAIPAWAKGVRVEKAGRNQWAVVATEARGH
jgi:hypothetical protein